MQQMKIETPQGRIFIRIWLPTERGTEPREPIILLHDSLGSVQLWREFPERLARETARPVIAYDRLGFGESDPFVFRGAFDFIADEWQTFAQVLDALSIKRFIVFGHSVGAVMAVNIAARFKEDCLAVIAESAIVFVEDVTLVGVRAAKIFYAENDQFKRLQKYHGEKSDWVLSLWLDTWLSEAFSDWSIDAALRNVRCPILAMQGDADEFGSTRHVERIQTVGGHLVRAAIIEACGHVPHREKPVQVLELAKHFLENLRIRQGGQIDTT